jgi:tRNA threonylcarbamoyladenosine biosynthesis protein TsaE
MIVKDEAELVKLGQVFGGKLRGGEVVELIGDIGAGKTTFVKGVALSLGISEEISSPSFTVMKEYSGEINDVLIFLKHYDFYRLDDAGLMKNEIIDSVGEKDTITVVEWAKDIAGVLSPERLKVKINYLPDGDGREVTIEGVEL